MQSARKTRVNAASVPPTVSDSIRCPVCQRFATLTDRGAIKQEYREPWCHRDHDNEPCRGWVGMKERVQA